jgi:hypothetical protein
VRRAINDEQLTMNNAGRIPAEFIYVGAAFCRPHIPGKENEAR